MQYSIQSTTLCAATPADQNFLFEVYARTRDELSQFQWSEDQKRMFLRQQFSARQQQHDEAYPRAEGSIILLRGQPVGRLLVDRNEHEIILIDIALLPENRNAGIGTFIIQGLINEAAGAGNSVKLHVLSSSPAVNLYERLGFSIVEAGSAYSEMVWRPAHSQS